MGEHSWALLLGSLGVLGAILSSLVLVRAGRRDRSEDKQTKRDDKVEKLGSRVTHVEGYLEGKDNDFRAYRE